ncbi:MAG: helix-turn-helix domain-containing protein [Bacteroidales bacterium]|nr:helix-turn-helix domain-containing protein [Bacteroidales bacterium]
MNIPKLTYKENTPHPSLNDYIKSYWQFTIRTNSPASFDILPDGYFDLMVIVRNNDIKSVKITGIWSKSVQIEYVNDTDVIGIRFKPSALDNLLKCNLNKLLNSSESVDLKEFGLCKQRFIDYFNTTEKKLINYLDECFMQRINDSIVNQRLISFFNIIQQSSGIISVKYLANKLNISPRQLQRYAYSNLGIGTKEYINIIKLKNTLWQLKTDKTDIYPYNDQSHFIKEVKKHTGYTPNKIDLNNDVRFLQYYDFTNS